MCGIFAVFSKEYSKNPLKEVIKGESGDSRGIIENIYKVVLGKDKSELTEQENKFFDTNAKTIKQLGEEIIS